MHGIEKLVQVKPDKSLPSYSHRLIAFRSLLNA